MLGLLRERSVGRVKVPSFTSLYTAPGNSRFESIQQSESNQIPDEFDLFGRLQSWCQQCVHAGNKTDALTN